MELKSVAARAKGSVSSPSYARSFMRSLTTSRAPLSLVCVTCHSHPPFHSLCKPLLYLRARALRRVMLYEPTEMDRHMARASRPLKRSPSPFPPSSSPESFDLSHIGPYGREWMEKYFPLDKYLSTYPAPPGRLPSPMQHWKEFNFCENVFYHGEEDYGMSVAEVAMWWKRGVEELEANDSLGEGDVAHRACPRESSYRLVDSSPEIATTGPRRGRPVGEYPSSAPQRIPYQSRPRWQLHRRLEGALPFG